MIREPLLGQSSLIFFFSVVVLLLSSFKISFVFSKTNPPDVSALNVMYSSMNSPSQLDGWKSSGGDPCGDSWKGIKCSGSSITEIDLSGLGLSGSMGYQLASLTSVTYFDLSKNKLKNDIPYQLPPKVQHLDLSGNELSGTVPYSISQMKDLKYLSLSHNKLNGMLTDMFGQLPKLTEMDLSFNSMTGNLPQSFKNLTGLSTLHLQNNQFTGSINVLRDLPLNDLNVANNHFSGWIPDELENIENLDTGGNSWSSGTAPPPPPGEKHHRRDRQSNDKETKKSGGGLNGAAIAGIVLGVLVVLVIIIALFTRKSSSGSSHFLEEDRFSQHRPFSPLASKQLSIDLPPDTPKKFIGMKSFDSSSSTEIDKLPASSSVGFKLGSIRSPSLDLRNSKRSSSVPVKCYSLTDLMTATGNFASSRLLGEGSIGRVYKAKYGDGRVMAVKKIDSLLIQGGRGGEFSEIVASIFKLCHSNIAELDGYCSEQGQNMLVYEYFRNGSLHGFLHLSDDFSKPLTWNTRVRIALGTARGLEYLHEVCSPSLIHKNIKSSNILLDSELNPHLTDCGLEVFYEATGPNQGTGYNAPECSKPLAYTLKSDVYSFGVVMLELLTGRMPFDSSRPRLEQSLVRWASPQLHDIEALARMVDPGLCGLYPPRSLSRFADIIALCLQSEPEFRPPMSQVVEAIVCVLEDQM